jgi:hypothetical protein
VVEALKAAFVQGRLAKDEFDTRVGQTLAARTYAELAALTADIPAAPAPAPLPRHPARPQARPGARPLARRPAYVPVVAATTTVTAALWAVVLSAPVDNGVVAFLLTAATFVCLGLLILTGAVTLESRHAHVPYGGPEGLDPS